MNNVGISVIVPVVERHDNLEELHRQFSMEFESIGKPYEFIFVVSREFTLALGVLDDLQLRYENVRVFKMLKNFGEAVFLSIGVRFAKGEYIFTLASYFQVEPEGIIKIWDNLCEGYDLVITRRYPRTDSLFNRYQSYIFHWLTCKMTKTSFHDMSCGLKGMRKNVLKEIQLYGNLHRFIPVLAESHGFRTKEIEVRQRKEDSKLRLAGVGLYSQRLLDIITIFFLTKFTMKPLRFFGSIGLGMFSIGTLITSYLGIYRLLGFGGIANRPVLLLGILLMVLGVQTLSLGFIGEIIIFTHARQIKEYNIDEYLTPH